MYKLIFFILIIVMLVSAYFIAKMIAESPFEKLSRDTIEIIDYAVSEDYDAQRVKIYSEGNFSLEDIYPTENRRLVYHLDDEYWVFWTGVVNLDDGLKFVYTPKYSRIIVVDKSSKEIISNKLFFRDVTNAKIVDGYVYFVYASFDNYKLGRFSLDD